MTEKLLLEIAKNLGYTIQLSNENSWHILPINSHQTWRLTATESRWTLSVRNVPQLLLSQPEAIAFLKSRHEPSN